MWNGGKILYINHLLEHTNRRKLHGGGGGGHKCYHAWAKMSVTQSEERLTSLAVNRGCERQCTCTHTILRIKEANQIQSHNVLGLYVHAGPVEFL